MSGKASFLSVRVSSETRKQFQEKASRYGQTAQVLRELIDAFVENRVTIAPPTNRKESLYVTRTEN